MAKLFNGSINFPSTMTPTGAQPLDDRSVVQSLADLLSDKTFGTAIYNGMMVSVVDEQKVYMLIDDTKATQEEGWVAVGSGNGSIAVETYAEAIALAAEDNIGQVIYVKSESEYDADGEEGEGVAIKYDAAPYIVIGYGQLMKLAASTASGDINSEVASLKTKVSGLETTVGNDESGLVKDVKDLKSTKVEQDDFNTLEGRVASAETRIEAVETAVSTKAEQQALDDAIINANTIAQGYANAAKSEAIAKAEELNGEMDTRVKALEAIDHEHENMDVLNGITAEKVEAWDKAQVNVIEKIVFNGTEVVVDNQTKTATLDTPADFISGLTEDKVLSVVDGKLGATIGLNYFTSGDTYEIQLVGKDKEVIGRINAKDFVKDGMLNNVELKKNPEGQTDGTYLIFTWNNEAGVTEPMYVPVTDLIDVYNAGNGLDLDGKTFSISLKSNEKYLEVTENGLATKGIDDAITTAKNAILGADGDAASAGTIYGAKKYADEKSATAEQNAKDYTDGAAANALTAATAYADEKMAEAKEYAEGLTSIYDEAGAAANALTAATAYADEKFVTKEGFNEFEAEYEEKLNGIAAGAEVNVIEKVVVNGIEATVEDKVATVKVEADDIELGTAIKNGEEIKYSGDTKLSVVLQGIQDSIRGAIAGGVNSVTAGDTVIDVNSADANNPTVSLKVEVKSEETIAAGHIEMVKGNNGLYGVMYYDGDDAE